MIIRKKKYKSLSDSINKLAETIQKGNVKELAYILGNKKEIMKRNLIAGLFRGVGIGIGVTVVTAIIISILQNIVKLNIPIIGEYISDLVDIVQKTR